MEGIYLTQEGKQEIEAKIAELEKEIMDEMNVFIHTATSEELNVYKKILLSATILPVEESWVTISDSTLALHYNQSFPKGVIIQPKQ
jgi:midasin (ATPase involved in ribosome maturation)